MGDSDRSDPGTTPHENLDTSDRYRNTAFHENAARTTARINYRDFYLPGEEPEYDPRPDYDPKYDESQYSHLRPVHEEYTAAEHLPHPGTAPEPVLELAPETLAPPAAPVLEPVPVELPAVAAAASTETADQAPAQASGPLTAGPALNEAQRLAQNPLVRFAAIGLLAGVIFGAILIGFSFLFAGPAEPYDLKTQTSDATGLTGHLYTKWEDRKLQYRLSFVPSYPDQRSILSSTIGDPPHPLSISIQLKDAMGFALCSNEILLPYNPPPPASGDAKSGPPAPDPAQQAAERQREQGKDVFAVRSGPDGKIDSLDAQGVMPCSSDAFGKVVGWGFTTTIPSLAEQNDLLKQKEKQTLAQRNTVAHKNAPRRPEKTLFFSIEGDDSIVGFDTTTGTLESSSGESFFVDPGASMAGWQNFPIQIHYRCDQSSSCTVTRVGSGAFLHARLRK
jgi:hypothetical protein